jgi:hypothetical protein
MHRFKIKTSSALLSIVIFLALVYLIFVLATGFFKNPNTYLLIVVFIGCNIFLVRRWGIALTEWVVTDENIQITWLTQFLIPKNSDRIIKWNEIAAYKITESQAYEYFKIVLKDGTTIRITHDFFIWKDDYERFLNCFLRKVEEHNGKEFQGEKAGINDKLIVVKGVSKSDLKQVLTHFCQMYNKEVIEIEPRMRSLLEREFAITLVHDIDFDVFCYLINFIKYPKKRKSSPEVTAWATTKNGDTWITEKSADKKAMLFISGDDTEQDNVYLTTEDNIGYKLGFSKGEHMQLLDAPKKLYVQPGVDV